MPLHYHLTHHHVADPGRIQRVCQTHSTHAQVAYPKAEAGGVGVVPAHCPSAVPCTSQVSVGGYPYAHGKLHLLERQGTLDVHRCDAVRLWRETSRRGRGHGKNPSISHLPAGRMGEGFSHEIIYSWLPPSSHPSSLLPFRYRTLRFKNYLHYKVSH